jgi:putative ABC transport system permease protein
MRSIEPLRQGLADAVAQLKGYRLRAVLAAAGVCVGVATMVALNNLLGSALASATEGMRRLGGDSVFILPKDQFSMRGRAPRALTLDDADALRRRKEYFSLVSPVFGIRGMVRACGQRQIVHIYGVSPDSYVLNGWSLDSGRFVQDLDVANRAAVTILSADLAAQFPCKVDGARQVMLSDRPFTVIGVLGAEGQFVGGESRNVVLIPLTTAESKYGATLRDSLAIFARIATGVPPGLAMDGARRLLRSRHGLASTNAPDDFVFQTRDELLAASFEQGRTATLAILIIMAITLTIAGIGIVNSVLTAVTERTSEIGLRRAVGARRVQIAAQFMIESVLISAGGGLAGAVIGYALSSKLAGFLQLQPWVNWRATVLAIVAAAILGLVGGLWPAIRAAELDPIDALRRE